jgi:hypothetical protein
VKTINVNSSYGLYPTETYLRKCLRCPKRQRVTENHGDLPNMGGLNTYGSVSYWKTCDDLTEKQFLKEMKIK